MSNIELALSAEQKSSILTLVKSVVALEKAEIKFDMTSKSIIDLFNDIFSSIPKDKGNFKDKVSATRDILLKEIKELDTLQKSTVTRVNHVINTVANLLLSGLKLKIKEIPFVLVTKVVDLHKDGYLSTKEINKALKKDEEDYKEALEDLCTKGAYKKLVGSVDFSMLDEDTVTLVKALDKSSLIGLQGLIKVQMGA